MATNGKIVVDKVTYYHEILWEALVEQNMEMGRAQSRQRELVDQMRDDLKQLRRDKKDSERELDFALEKLEELTKRVTEHD